MPTYQNPPPALSNAIHSASSTYGVPEDVLTGIWRVESGSSYPNPYVNSSGYGGLFGTKNWYASTTTQADTAASILANLLQKDAGNLSQALSQYSGGGYTSVPGETTFGTVTPGGSFAGVPTSGSVAPDATSPSAPGCPGPWCYLPGATLFNKACANCTARGNKQVQSAADAAKDAATGGWTAIAGVFGTIAKFLANIVSYLKRGGLILGGAVLIVVGVVLMGREAVSA